MSWLGKVFGAKEKHSPVSLNDGNFGKEVLQYEGACLVDVWGPSCQPCEKLAPIIVDLAGEYHGRVKVCEMNAADAQKSASRIGVRGTPTILAYKNGAEIGRFVGWKPKSFLKQMIEAEFGDVMPDAPAGEAGVTDTTPDAPSPDGGKKLSGKAAKKAARRAKLRQLQQGR